MIAAAAAGVTMPLMFVLFGTLISLFVSSPHIIDVRAGEFVGNFTSFINGDVQDLGGIEKDLDRLWYGYRPFRIIQATYLQ